MVFLLHGFEGALTRDLALYAYSGQQLAEGVPPYVAVLNRAGPLAHLLPGFGALAGRALGVEDLLAMRVLLMVVSVGCVWVAYLLARDLFASRLAGAVAAVTLLGLEGFVDYATGGPREKTTMVLLALLALWALVHRRWLSCGAAVALATLAWQPIFFPLSVAALVAGVAVPGARPTGVALLRFAAGGLVVTGVTVAGFAAVGALPELYEGFLAVNLSHTTQRTVVDTLAEHPRLLGNGYGPAVYAALAGLLWLVGAAVLRRVDRRSGASCALPALGAATVVSCLWAVLLGFQAWPDFFAFLPLAVLGVAGLASCLAGLLPDRAVKAVTTPLLVLALVAAGVASWESRSTRLVDQRAQTAAVLDLAGPDATVLSVGAPQPLVFSGQRNPIRHQMFRGGMGDYLDETYPGGLEGVAREIEAARPTFITLDNPQRYEWLAPLLARGYLRIGGTRDTYVWFVDDDVPTEQVAALRAALGESRTGPSSGRVRRSPP